MRDALAVYYFPGMWDWDRGVRLPLVAQELERALTRQREASGADTAEMAREDVEVYPVPSPANCPPCPYFEPCRALQAGRDAQPILLSQYRRRPALVPQEGRLGGRAWGLGRGAAPPRFRRALDG